MRWFRRATCACAVVLALAGAAAAETRDELQARGEALGRDGKWSDAIRAFKSAERLEHRAVHACLIALAYARREAWPQAEVFVARCHEPSGETLPEWVGQLDELIRTRVATGNAELTIQVVPAGAAATLTASSFEPDEQFTPRTIHVPRGTLLVVARAPGYPEQQRVVIVDSEKPRTLAIDMTARPAPREAPYAHSLRIAGIASAGLGLVAAGFAVKLGLDARNDAAALENHQAGTPWTHEERVTFDAGAAANRDMYVASIAGGALVVTAAVLYYVSARAHVAPVVSTQTASIAMWGRF